MACAGEIACKSISQCDAFIGSAPPDSQVATTITSEDKPSKWEGMSNEQLLDDVCACFNFSHCEHCKMPNYTCGTAGDLTCSEWIAEHPTEARTIMLKFLEGREKE
jgi:hypothetical protein